MTAREITEGLMASFYDLERAARAELGAAKAGEFIQWWIGKLREQASQLGSIDFDAWRA